MKEQRIKEEELKRIWKVVSSDREGARALREIKKYGFDLGAVPIGLHTWSGMTASIPLLPNRRARSRVLRKPRSAAAAIKFLVELSEMLRTPYLSFETRDPIRKCIYIHNLEGVDLGRMAEMADFLRRVTSVQWVLTEHNPRQNAIASIRWEIRHRTGNPHDRELMDLLDAVFRASGTKEPFDISWESLKKSDINERETRMAARRKLLKGSSTRGGKS